MSTGTTARRTMCNRRRMRVIVIASSASGGAWATAVSHSSNVSVRVKVFQPFGNPPVVASKYLSRQLKADIQKLLMTMHKDPEGKKILDELMIDRFLYPEDKWYESIVAMNHACNF